MRICNAFLIAIVCAVSSSAQDQIVDLFPNVAGMTQLEIKSPAQSPVVMSLSKPKPISATESTVTVTLKMAKGVEIYADSAAKPALDFYKDARLQIKLLDRGQQPIATKLRFPKPISERIPIFNTTYFIYREQANIQVTYKTDAMPVAAQIKYQGSGGQRSY